MIPVFIWIGLFTTSVIREFWYYEYLSKVWAYGPRVRRRTRARSTIEGSRGARSRRYLNPRFRPPQAPRLRSTRPSHHPHSCYLLWWVFRGPGSPPDAPATLSIRSASSPTAARAFFSPRTALYRLIYGYGYQAIRWAVGRCGRDDHPPNRHPCHRRHHQ